MSLYRELAEHIADGVGADAHVDADELHAWMVVTDTGGHPAWERFYEALDGLLAAYLPAKGAITP